jgi:hypothetical protein
MDKPTSIDYLESLESAEDAEGEDSLSTDEDENPDDSGEAEQLASTADAPRVRSIKGRTLTSKQQAFIAAKISGMSNSQAYREAYPTDGSSDRVIAANAYRLTRHPLIAPVLERAWEETVEHLTEDAAATKRYVLKSLLALSKTAKQEGSRIKALELMGKAVGVFTPVTDTVVIAPTADQLKKELSGHLKLLKRDA